MEYTKIPDWFEKEYKEKFETTSRTIKEIDEDPVLWAWFKFGIKFRLHQAYCVHRILTSKNKRIIICWARQLGKSIGLGIFDLWATKHNKYSWRCYIFPLYVNSSYLNRSKNCIL